MADSRVTPRSMRRTMRRILAPSWRAALRIAEHDGPRGIAIMGALSRLQYRARIGPRNHSGP